MVSFYSVSVMYIAELLPVIFPRDGSLFCMEGVSLRPMSCGKVGD